jgi:zinc transport system substrate-binding protein
MKRIRVALGLATALALVACGEPATPPDSAHAADEPLVVYAVNHPLAWLAERIGAEHVAVVFPAPAGVDPASWSPDAETVAAYQRADLVLLNGAGYARWVSRAALRRSRSVDTSAAFEERWLPLDAGITHGHGPEGEHTHQGWASTTWLDPTLAVEQGHAITEALVAALPERETAIRARFEQVAGELRALDTRLAAAAKRLDGAPLLFSHPVYPYLIARYRLGARALHWEPDEKPSESEWAALEALLVEYPARVLFWEAEPLPYTTVRLEALGVKSLVYDPCANAPKKGDFLSVAGANVQALEKAANRVTPKRPR